MLDGGNGDGGARPLGAALALVRGLVVLEELLEFARAEGGAPAGLVTGAPSQPTGSAPVASALSAADADWPAEAGA